MNRGRILPLLLCAGLALAGCGAQGESESLPASSLPAATPSPSPTAPASPPPGGSSDLEESDVTQKQLTLTVNGQPVEVSWQQNKAVEELTAYAETEEILVYTSRYGGFEQVGDLPQSFSRQDRQMTTQPGDIVLYAGDQLVVFFGSNSWSYTKLGQIEGLSVQELSDLLGDSEAEIRIGLE